MRGVAGGTALPTPVEPGSELLSVQVMTRWYFVPGN